MRRYLLIAALGALSSGCLSGGEPEYARAEDRVPLGRMIAQLPAPTVSAQGAGGRGRGLLANS